ncbi:serine hydrolase domain-containing protein [Marivita hallyeonensis]|uniref:D-alanyl-D-alanine carboxypeptidase n=1 Tax=Marivita hallyeonensis TaxID=996342 RepID=A0A1M5S4W3_9RHOB|nr:serine hydrolase domain-containing protein [Marivita hallyeonensis]SHH33328.1 D-alanyl-D-alanine carboxypeptidase [Marivita hallyeonensis]
MRRSIQAECFALVAAAGSLFCTAAMAEDGALKNLLSEFHKRYGFPGATAAVALPDGKIVTAATGVADMEANRPMAPDTPMLAASIGKSFVAATLLSLESDRVLSRKDLVSEHLGGFDWFGRLPNHATVTVGDLMRHGAGLPDHVHLESFQIEMAARLVTGAAALTPEEAIAFILDAEPLFDAGSGGAYTDTGYLLLGLVIEQASGRSYYDIVTERFLDQLGLADTRPSNQRTLHGLAVGYVAEDNLFNLPPRTIDAQGTLLWDPSMEWTGGGLVSTSGDLAAWGQALFTGAAMESPYLDRLLDAIPVSPDAPGILYGAGVAIYADTPRGPVYGHGGWIPGYVSSLRHYANHDVTVAFQINTDVGIVDDSTDLVPALEAALADLAIELARTDGSE